MPVDYAFATPVALPAQSAIVRVYPSVQLADAYAIRLPPGALQDPEVLARFMFANQPAWVDILMRIRDAIVARLGLKTGKQLATLEPGARTQRVGIFRIYSKNATEIVVGEDDKHLDFRVSLLCVDAQLTVSTVVHCHNRLGRTYLRLIAPFHRLVVQESLRRAARIGWPSPIRPIHI
jgi:hypothetical protein